MSAKRTVMKRTTTKTVKHYYTEVNRDDLLTMLRGFFPDIPDNVDITVSAECRVDYTEKSWKIEDSQSVEEEERP
jgi:hypothetical protein